MLLLSFYSEEPVKLIKISSIPEGISDSVVFCYWRMVACFLSTMPRNLEKVSEMASFMSTETHLFRLQCSDAVGWVAGRASGL